MVNTEFTADQFQKLEKLVNFDSKLGQYVVHYPFNSLKSKVPSYRNQNLAVMQSWEKRISKNPEILSLINNGINEMLEKGVHKLESDLPRLAGLQESFVPITHSLARKDDIKATTRVRLAHNCSFKRGSDISLNDSMPQTPEYLPLILHCAMPCQLFLG